MNFTKEKFKTNSGSELLLFFLLIRGGFLSKRRKNVGMPRKTGEKNLDKIVEKNIAI